MNTWKSESTIRGRGTNIRHRHVSMLGSENLTQIMDTELSGREPIVREPADTTADVVVIGGGLAGKAASIHLAKAGLDVICIDLAEPLRAAVGESLDWSAPELLRSLGLPMEEMIQSEMATWKRHVTVQMSDGCAAHYDPSPWLARKPFNIELRTLHVDRTRLDQRLLEIAADTGVRFVKDKVVGVERDKRRISSVHSADGSRFSARWFVDASGFATRLLAREFNLAAIPQGPAKVAIWGYFAAPQIVEGTTLFMESPSDDYLSWLWEIPINPQTVSVGLVDTGQAIKTKRAQGLSVEDIFREQLGRFSRFESLLQAVAPDSLRVTSFRCQTHLGLTGPNWIIAGEAASMVDPMTANGLTAALRHAHEGAQLIVKSKQGRLPLLSRLAYSNRIVQMATFFNSGIERVIYQPSVRRLIGLGTSGTVYTSPAWSINVLYSRFGPDGLLSTWLFALLLRSLRAAAWALFQVCRLRNSAEVVS